MIHKHHNPPRHRVGNHDNVVEVSPTCHAMFHFCEWKLHGLQEDFIAWRALTKQINPKEISEEVEMMRREKISKAHKGHSRKHSEESKRKIREGRKNGKKPDIDVTARNKAISLAKKGKPLSEAHKAALRKPKRKRSQIQSTDS